MAKLDFRKLASDRGGAAGAFDPQTLLIHFPDPQGRATNAAMAWEVISDQPVSVIAHEFTHYFQMTSTAYGLKRMIMFLEGFIRKMLILREYVLRTDGHVRGPIMENAIELAQDDPQFALGLSHLIGLLARERQQDGGWSIDINELSPLIVEVNHALYLPAIDGALTVAGFCHPPIIDLAQFNGPPKHTTLGAWHLLEGAALAIQLIQARLHNLPGEAKATLGQRTVNLSSSAQDSIEPYFIANMIYSTYTRVNREFQRHACLEEFFLIADLALMHDPVIENWHLLADNGETDHREAHRKLMYSDLGPGNAFIAYLGTAALNIRKIPRARSGWDREDFANFQNMIRKCNNEGSVLDTVAACDRFARFAFGELRARWPLQPETLDLIEDMYLRALSFRASELKGGAVMQDMLQSKERLIEFMKVAVPGVILGTQMVSWDRSPGVGVAVELQTLSTVSALLNSLLFGGAECRLHSGVRQCVVEPHRLCHGGRFGSAALNRKSRCQREDALMIIMASSEAKSLAIN